MKVRYPSASTGDWSNRQWVGQEGVSNPRDSGVALVGRPVHRRADPAPVSGCGVKAQFRTKLLLNLDFKLQAPHPENKRAVC
ncbi:hypothetical protein chiPu_0005161 [Chiloscyllium punctatum]|uniref:Uncharacterized protein n=1 Tax=Chiloscyllium punctatum TaxID=137246 RepID=A0A401S8M6_CHIPU|nr:hypothetical protein [Chiloscyllium punctatum]